MRWRTRVLMLEEALHDSGAMQSFVDIALAREGAPDESRVCKFRHLSEQNGLADELVHEVRQQPPGHCRLMLHANSRVVLQG
jgi:transposase, IS5 family